MPEIYSLGKWIIEGIINITTRELTLNANRKIISGPMNLKDTRRWFTKYKNIDCTVYCLETYVTGFCDIVRRTKVTCKTNQ